MTRPRDIADSINRINSSAADATAVTIDSSEQVGIGTTSPAEMLHVFHASANINAIIESGDANAYLAFKDNSTSGNAHVFLGASGDDMTFFSGGSTERMRIDSSGNVGIGTTTITSGEGFTPKVKASSASSPAIIVENTAAGNQQVSIGASGGATISVGGHSSAASNVLVFRTANADNSYSMSERMRVTSGGDIGIGTTSPAGKLHVAGTIVLSASGTDANRADVFYNSSTGQLILVTSDARLKKDFDYDIGGIETVKKLKPLRYSWKDSDRRQLGFLAQESIEADEHLAWNDTENDNWGLEGWDGFAAVLTKAIQEQQVIIEDLKARIEALEKE